MTTPIFINMKNQQNNVENPSGLQETVPVVMIRHAQSQWNRENRFTGWADPPLTDKGVAEARQATKALRAHGYRFDTAYSSRLQRATATCDLLLEGIGEEDVPCYQDWRLNERHYGTLQGLDKEMATEQVGEHQVWCWRRGYIDRAGTPGADSSGSSTQRSALCRCRTESSAIGGEPGGDACTSHAVLEPGDRAAD